MRLIAWDREFKVRVYGFGYSGLLFRNAPRFGAEESIEVLFSNVRHMSISPDLPSLLIDRVETPEESGGLGIGIAVPSAPEGLFALNSGAVAFRAVPGG
ncbi:hypothetical protein [Streptomyces novaecaesareae]|uniref:hypothetical protein n=1 Tax=Streptomyces novaecaesareae TaxID=68244 RepID=UPI0004ABA4E2|nr:hypothetical protein [Streptomyces novaecaesareae]